LKKIRKRTFQGRKLISEEEVVSVKENTNNTEKKVKQKESKKEFKFENVDKI
jgi:hypothetical protein